MRPREKRNDLRPRPVDPWSEPDTANLVANGSIGNPRVPHPADAPGRGQHEPGAERV
jgi:hypothetical protein